MKEKRTPNEPAIPPKAAVFPYMPLLNITRRNAEMTLLALMSLGNPTFLAAQLESCVTARIGEAINELSSTSLTQAKYQGVAFTNLACRAALEAGAAEANVRTISSDASHRCALMTDPVLQWDIARETLLRLCEEIRNARLGSCSTAIRQCCEYIDRNLSRSFSLNKLNEVCGLSCHYISDLFRSELGLGALQYTHQLRLQHAKFLLEHTALSIKEIAQHLGFPSHSNFSQRFRLTYGITPYEYRSLFAK